MQFEALKLFFEENFLGSDSKGFIQFFLMINEQFLERRLIIDGQLHIPPNFILMCLGCQKNLFLDWAYWVKLLADYNKDTKTKGPEH